jgi:CheY-like chemotaxis protein
VPRLLLVEDDLDSREVLARHLRRKGYEVLQAADGHQGLELARTGSPDLILLDMSLPVLDGWAAARQLKTKSQTRAIPVLAVTAHAMSGDRQKALEAGCDDYATKPLDLPALLRKIESLLLGRVRPGQT